MSVSIDSGTSYMFPWEYGSSGTNFRWEIPNRSEATRMGQFYDTMLDHSYPGTNVYDQLGTSAGGMASPIMSSSVGKAGLDSPNVDKQTKMQDKISARSAQVAMKDLEVKEKTLENEKKRVESQASLNTELESQAVANARKALGDAQKTGIESVILQAEADYQQTLRQYNEKRAANEASTGAPLKIFDRELNQASKGQASMGEMLPKLFEMLYEAHPGGGNSKVSGATREEPKKKPKGPKFNKDNDKVEHYNSKTKSME